jgi:glucan biosynthesis protein C
MVPLVLIEIILRPRWPGLQNLYNDWANSAYYSTCLITGFLLAKYPALEQALHREWKRALGISLVGMVLRVPSAVGIIISPVLSYVGLVVAGWGAIVALLGFAQGHLMRTNAVLDYFKESAYPVYILHQAAVVCIGYGIIQLPLGVAAKYALLLAASFAATLAAYELIVKRFSILRFAFGMNPK